MSKTAEEMAEEYVWKHYKYSAINHQLDFLAGYKAAQQEYEAKIQELETQLENWQHNAIHGDDGL